MGAARYTKRLLDNYCVLDTETTGLSHCYDEVIEIGILKVRDGNTVDQYSQLIKPRNAIDGFITNLTGITNKMVKDKPTIKEVENDVLAFLGDDVIVGYNTLFDIRFLNAGFNKDISNEYMDTVQFARKVYPELEHHIKPSKETKTSLICLLIIKDMLTFSSCKIVFQVTIQRLTFGAEMLLLRKAVFRRQWTTILHLLKKSMCF